MSSYLPVDIQQRIDAQLASGSFATEEEVLREALEALERRQRGLTQLRESVAVGEADVAAGRISTFNRDEIKRDIRDRLAARGIRE
jgi:putative addiction module CopG family antidote